jgi:hypothetical protein
MRARIIIGLALASLALPIANAEGATILGKTPPTAGIEGNCGATVAGGSVVQQSGADGVFVIPPGGGVITEWSHQANASAQQKMRLRIFRANGGDSYTAVAESAEQQLTPGTLNRFAVRIPVAAGGLLGLGNGMSPFAAGACIYAATGRPADSSSYTAGADSPLNVAATFTPFPAGYVVNVAAVLEPDADHDNFGDETQDKCPGSAGGLDGCPLQALIGKHPKKKSKSAKATFEFSSNDPAATFQCALGKLPLKPCGSPKKFRKLEARKHKFKLVAIDAAGNASAPAVFRWRVLD